MTDPYYPVRQPPEPDVVLRKGEFAASYGPRIADEDGHMSPAGPHDIPDCWSVYAWYYDAGAAGEWCWFSDCPTETQAQGIAEQRLHNPTRRMFLLPTSAKEPPTVTHDPLTIAYMALGAKTYLIESNSCPPENMGELELISAVVDHASLLDRLYEDYDIDTPFCYEVAEPYGRLVAIEVLDSGGEISANLATDLARIVLVEAELCSSGKSPLHYIHDQAEALSEKGVDYHHRNRFASNIIAAAAIIAEQDRKKLMDQPSPGPKTVG